MSYLVLSINISEKTLHEGFECMIAKNKQEVEEGSYATTEQKEAEKNRRESFLKNLEKQAKADIKRKNIDCYETDKI